MRRLSVFFILCVFWTLSSQGQNLNLNPVLNSSPAASPTPLPSPSGLSSTTIKQIDNDARKIVSETTGDLSKLDVGAHFVATIDGRNCIMPLISGSGKIAELDGAPCPYFENLKVGQPLDPSLFDLDRPTPNPQRLSKWEDGFPRDDRLRF